uniref:Na+/H+ antiporter NhaC family protein n=1 Tax=Thaumasiovibrio occultus TaxID=1891184 RepID=UPI000B3600E2|nr:Na+/H+ antiporter NhaC family protein [Thaumasiovibrio occultus]
MELIDYSNSFISLLPPVVALSLAIITRRVLLSLGVGIALGAFFLNDYSLISTFKYLFNTVANVITDINKLYILCFLAFLGMMTAVLTLSGGTRAFAEWSQNHIKDQRGAKLLTAFLGVFIFVDDYFNSLAVGSIARPVTDRYQVSRAKLAYLLDSTAAPMCVLMPASSWGAYIITVIGGILIEHNVTDYSPIGAFMTLIPLNFYAVFALVMVFVVAWFKVDVGPMRRHEQLVKEADSNKQNDATSDLNDELGIEESLNGRVSDLIMPISILIVATISMMILTGYQTLAADGKAFSVLGAFENTNVGVSLFWGGVIGLLAAMYPVWRQRLPGKEVASTLRIGAQSMFGAILILLFAWSIGTIISDIQTGQYLSHIAEGNIPTEFLPLLLFVLAGFMAFSTGTSWGTFAIMLPIAGNLAQASDIALMLPMLGAVLAGAVFGDHCSPISDTTILSSTGARCNHIDHVKTQLPYSLSVAFVASIGFLTIGFTKSLPIAFMVTTFAFIVMCFIMIRISANADKKLASA